MLKCTIHTFIELLEQAAEHTCSLLGTPGPACASILGDDNGMDRKAVFGIHLLRSVKYHRTWTKLLETVR